MNGNPFDPPPVPTAKARAATVTPTADIEERLKETFDYLECVYHLDIAFARSFTSIVVSFVSPSRVSFVFSLSF